MSTSNKAKLFGWLQFAITAANQFVQTVTSTGTPHGWQNWLVVAASGAMAVATHAASNTDGTK